MSFAYTLILATPISLRYLKMFSICFRTAENIEFCKMLRIKFLMFKDMWFVP